MATRMGRWELTSGTISTKKRKAHCQQHEAFHPKAHLQWRTSSNKVMPPTPPQTATNWGQSILMPKTHFHYTLKLNTTALKDVFPHFESFLSLSSNNQSGNSGGFKVPRITKKRHSDDHPQQTCLKKPYLFKELAKSGSSAEVLSQ